MQLAALADIHGNRWALEAVLEDLERRGVRQVFHLGDFFYGPLDPAGTAALLLAREAPSDQTPNAQASGDPASSGHQATIRGNQDRVLVEPSPAMAENPTFVFVQEELPAAALRWLAALPHVRRWNDVLLCHGTPDADDAPLLETVTPSGVVLRPPGDVARIVDAAASDDRGAASGHPTLVLCAHTHVPRTFGLADGTLVVNPGSVGLPAYTDDEPFAHAMASGSPHARYAILSREDAETAPWRIEHVGVPYDHQRAARAAEARERPDWAHWLRTGHG